MAVSADSTNTQFLIRSTGEFSVAESNLFDRRHKRMNIDWYKSIIPIAITHSSAHVAHKIVDAIIEPRATVEAKSIHDILANERNPNSLSKMINPVRTTNALHAISPRSMLVNRSLLICYLFRW